MFHVLIESLVNRPFVDPDHHAVSTGGVVWVSNYKNCSRKIGFPSTDREGGYLGCFGNF